MKKTKTNQQHWKRYKLWRRLRPLREGLDTTRQYTQKEMQSLSQNPGNGPGIMRPDTGDLHLPNGLEESNESDQADSASQVMMVIVTLTLIIICILVYLIHQMPNKD